MGFNKRSNDKILMWIFKLKKYFEYVLSYLLNKINKLKKDSWKFIYRNLSALFDNSSFSIPYNYTIKVE